MVLWTRFLEVGKGLKSGFAKNLILVLLPCQACVFTEQGVIDSRFATLSIKFFGGLSQIYDKTTTFAIYINCS